MNPKVAYPPELGRRTRQGDHRHEAASQAPAWGYSTPPSFGQADIGEQHLPADVGLLDRVGLGAVRLLIAEGFAEARSRSGSYVRHRPEIQRMTRSWYTDPPGGSPSALSREIPRCGPGTRTQLMMSRSCSRKAVNRPT